MAGAHVHAHPVRAGDDRRALGVALALIFSRVPFYEYYTHAPRLVAGLTPLIDQTVAGAVLMVLGKATMAVMAVAVFFRWFAAEHRADQAHAIARP